MRDIEGIETVVALLKPHWSEIDKHFAGENQAFKELLATPNDESARVLKCHLVVEHYVERFLEHQIPRIREARLTFAQKATLLPVARSGAAFVRPGILKLNAIRNRFAHNLGARVSFDDLGPIREVLSASRPNVTFESAVAALEAFVTVACTFLIVAPPELEEVFANAFAAVRVRDNSEDAA
jgi:hypothetical protein